MLGDGVEADGAVAFFAAASLARALARSWAELGILELAPESAAGVERDGAVWVTRAGPAGVEGEE